MNDYVFFNYFSESEVQGTILDHFLQPDLIEETDLDCEEERALLQMNNALVPLFPAFILMDTHIPENEESL